MTHALSVVWVSGFGGPPDSRTAKNRQNDKWNDQAALKKLSFLYQIIWLEVCLKYFIILFIICDVFSRADAADVWEASTKNKTKLHKSRNDHQSIKTVEQISHEAFVFPSVMLVQLDAEHDDGDIQYYKKESPTHE